MATDPALEALRRYSEDFEEGTLDTEALLTRARARESTPALRPGRRLAPALALTAAFFVANVGLAFAANGSAPGDTLYAVDRAYERIAGAVGLADESPEERLDEAAVVAARGEPRRAVIQTGRALRALDDAPGLPEAILAVAEAEAELRGPAPEGETIGIPDEVLRTAVEDLIATAHEVADAAKAGTDPAAAARRVQEKAAEVAAAARGKRPDHAGKDNAPGQGGESDRPGKGRAGEPPGRSGRP